MQQYSSAKTSINSKKIPALFKLINWEKNTDNLDYGGGKYDTATAYLMTVGVQNHIYDKYNRPEEINQSVLAKTDYNTCTISNVLNVIDNKNTRLNIVLDAYNHIKQNGLIYIKVYEGDKSGEFKANMKRDTFQMNQPTYFYYNEIIKYFKDININKQVEINLKQDLIILKKI